MNQRYEGGDSVHRIEVDLPESLIEELVMSEKVQKLLEASNTKDLEEDFSVIITEALERYLNKV